MYVIPSVEIDEEIIKIPVYRTNEFAFIEWKENENVDDLLKKEQFDGRWCSVKSWIKDHEDESFPTYELVVIDFTCFKTAKKYHLITYDDLNDFSEIENSVCLPFNRLNLLLFYKEYILPFSGVKNFTHG